MADIPLVIPKDPRKVRLRELKAKGMDKLSKEEIAETLDLILELLHIN